MAEEEGKPKRSRWQPLLDETHDYDAFREYGQVKDKQVTLICPYCDYSSARPEAIMKSAGDHCGCPGCGKSSRIPSELQK